MTAAALLLAPIAPAFAAQPWTLQKTIQADTAPVSAPEIRLQLDAPNHTLYATDFAVPFTDPPQTGYSRLLSLDTATDVLAPTLDIAPPGGGEPDRFVVDSASRTVYVPLQAGNIQTVDGATNTLGSALTTPAGAQPWGAALDTANDTLYVTDGASDSGTVGMVYVFDTTTGALTSTIGNLDDVLGDPYLDPSSGNLFIPMQADDYILVIATTGPDRNQVIGAIYGSPGDFNGPTRMVIDPIAHRGYVYNARTPTVTTIDTSALQVVGSPITLGTADESISDIDVDPATQTLYAAMRTSTAGEFKTVDLAHGDVTATTPVPQQMLGSIRYDAASGKLYVSGSSTTEGFIWVYTLADTPTPSPTPVPSSTGVVAHAGGPQLADTGTDVSWGVVLAAAGALVLGTIAVVRAHRRSRRRKAGSST